MTRGGRGVAASGGGNTPLMFASTRSRRYYDYYRTRIVIRRLTAFDWIAAVGLACMGAVLNVALFGSYRYIYQTL